MIQAVELTKEYGSRRAIRDLTFHAEKGEIPGFLGPNGAGKTTTMRILDESTIGPAPQQVALFGEMIRSIGKNRTVPLSSHILPEVQQLCDRVLMINKGQSVTEDTPQQLKARL